MTSQVGYGDEVRIRIAGPAGFGIKAAGATLARVFAHDGYHAFLLTEYPSLIKGGHNTVHLRISAQPIHSHVTPTDIMVALDRPSVALHVAEFSPGALVIHDPDTAPVDETDLAGREDLCIVGVPLDAIVKEAGGQKVMRNIAALGAVLGVLDRPLGGLTASIRAQFAHKDPEVAQTNIAVASAAHAYARAHACAHEHHLSAVANPVSRGICEGNEAVGLGAVAAGAGFYAAYPMTPASSLLHFMAAHGEEYGVVVKHAEDEIAAMNMVLGASWGGTRAMCATSGGGFALMVEALGFAGVSETACVVGLFTRPGPATGMPTWTEQSDLRFALHAAQGEFPRVVLSPGTHEDSFELAWQAFNLADQLQTPVIMLSDSYAAESQRTVDPFDTASVTVDRGRLVVPGEQLPDDALLDGRYARYAPAPDGVSVRALPGVDGAVHLVNSYEHDAYGYGAAGETAANRTQQNTKRFSKLDAARELVPPPRWFGPPEADVSLLFFGSTTMPALEAMRWLEATGRTVNALQVVTLWPFPAKEITTFLDTAHFSVCVEGNVTGQLEGLVREHCLRACDERIHRSDGRPFSPEELFEAIQGLLGTMGGGEHDA